MTGPHESLGHDRRAKAVRVELESTLDAFHELLEAIPDSLWQTKGVGSAWKVHEEMWHIAWGVCFTLNLVKNARRGIGFPNPPMVIADPINALYSRLRSFSSTKESIGARYDKTHLEVLATLDRLAENEWDSTVRVFGQEQSIANLIHGITHHFHEHAARIRPLLD